MKLFHYIHEAVLKAQISFYAFLIYKLFRSMRRIKLKVPKCEIFDRSDFHAFYTIKFQWGATLGLN
jgi:hypothetical protein